MNINYTKSQKFISYLLIFSLLFTQTVSLNFLGFITQIFAIDNTRINLVSILVEDSKYDELKDSIQNYAKNIQNTLENTRVVIIPTPSLANPYTIASINEKMFFEGYKWINGGEDRDTHLIGTVLVGDIPLPVVEKNGSYEKTILPYVDFEDKEYIYDPVKQVYQYNQNNSMDFKAEIWHGYIGGNGVSTQEIKDYFAKNDDYYKGKGLFKIQSGITNGVYNEDYISGYEPHVFYFDQIRENESIKEVEYKAYKLYLENLEDISYNRFYKRLADKLQNAYLTFQGNFIGDLSGFLSKNGIDPSKYNFNSNKADISGLVPDIQTRHIIYNSVKRFYQIFNSNLFENYRKNIYNAGRYNFDNDKVNGDFIPFIITNLDLYTDGILRNVNNDLEEYIDSIVIGSGTNNKIPAASRRIAIPTDYFLGSDDNVKNNYINYYHGKPASTIKEAGECMIYRGSTFNSGQVVEANRGFNVNNASSDAARCLDKTTGFWGRNSPIDLDINSINNAKWKLNGNDLKKATEPLFDIKGSVSNTPGIKNPDPRLCFDFNFILSNNITCSTINNNFTNDWTFEKAYNNWTILPQASCETHDLYLDGKKIKTQEIDGCSEILDDAGNIIGYKQKSLKYIRYKLIDSYIIHKSPNSEELSNQINHLSTPNLPIDRDRYIDYIARNGTYQKINYPYFYRQKLIDDVSLTGAKLKVKEYLDFKSNYINKILDAGKPNGDFFYNNFYKKGPYPSSVDLYNYIKNKPDITYSFLGDTKKVKYLDTLEFAVFWNSLNSVPAKYKFVMENYLSDQFLKNDLPFILPKNKKQYEISYIGAPGDPKNMYIKVDPENKLENPYTNVISKNIELDSILLGNKTGYSSLYSDLLSKNLLNSLGGNLNNGNGLNGYNKKITNEELLAKKQKEMEERQDKCGPPEGVPIWEWIGAITCRLGSILPPKITINEGNCGYSLSNYSYDNLGEGGYLGDNGDNQNNANYINYTFTDNNKNGVNDLLEKALSGSVRLDLGQSVEKVVFKTYYNKSQNINIKLLDKDGNLIYFDSVGTLSGELIKLTIPKDLSKDFSSLNKEVIFDKLGVEKSGLNSVEAREKAKTYFGFNDYSTKIQNGKGQISYSSMGTDVDAIIRITYTLKDKDKNIVKTLYTDYNVEVRGNLFYSQSHKLYKFEDEIFFDSGDNTIESSDKNNIFIGESKNILGPNIDKNNLFNRNNVKEKLFISLQNQDKNGNQKQLNYPLKYNILTNKGISYLSGSILSLESFKELSIKDSGIYNLEITDKFGNIINQEINILPTSNFGNNSLRMDLGSNIMESDGSIITNVLTVFDEYGNGMEGKNLKVDLEISGDSIVFEDGTKKQSFNLNERFKLFRVKSTSKIGKSSIKAIVSLNETQKKEIIENIEVVKNLKLEINFKNKDIKVGGGKYEFDVKVGGNHEGSKFNSRLYLRANKLYINSPDSYIVIKDNIGTGYFNTTTLAGKNIRLEFKAEGLKSPKYINIDIKPDLAVKVFLNIPRPNIEAKKGKDTLIQAELKDRYGNIVWTENTSGTIEIDDKYKSIITLVSNNISFIEGKAKFSILATDIPGTGYFKVNVPSVSSNSIKIGDKTISGIGENAGKIETFYFWNKEKIYGNKYNSIYTTLLLSNYGDVTVKDNLANSIIFDKNNRGLVVTSLLSPPYRNLDTVNISPNGKVQIVDITNDLGNDISTFTSFSGSNLQLELFNNTLSAKVGVINYNLSGFKSIKCESEDFSKCINKDKNSIGVYTSKKLDNNELGFVLRDENNKELLRIENGKIIKDTLISLELKKDSQGDYLQFNIKKGLTNLGVLAINAKNKFNINLDSSGYSLKSNYIGNTTKDDFGYTISYNEDYGVYSQGLNEFSESFEYGYENFSKNKNVGWELGNKILLSFAAGKGVGDATRDYQSFGLINIGDPVVSLKNLKRKIPTTDKDARFDKTIGNLVSKDEKNIGFGTFDYNNDKREDIIILKSNGFVELLEGTFDIDNFIDRKNLIHIPDFLRDKESIKTGDFTGDGYYDFIVLNTKKQVILFDNSNKDFKRYDLDLFGSGTISQIEVYDMNKDGKTDIVALVDNGDIYNFYGTRQVGKFVKKLVDKGQGINLDSKIRTDNSAIYFDGMYKMDETYNGNTGSGYWDQAYLNDLIKESKDLLSKSNATRDSNFNGGNNSNPKEFNEDAILKMIYIMLNYTPFTNGSLVKQNLAPESNSQSKQTIIDAIPPSPGHGADFKRDELVKFIGKDLEKQNPGNVSYDIQIDNNSNTTFIRSEYAQYEGLKVEKQFLDINGYPLRSNDIINYKASFKNISGKTLNNFALTDLIPREFVLKKFEKITISGKEIPYEKINFKSGVGGYDFLIDSYKDDTGVLRSISLSPGEEIVYEIKLETIPFSYGNIDIGYFNSKGNKNTENNPNSYPEILLSSSKYNCGNSIVKYNTNNGFDYNKINLDKVCDISNDKNTKDTNNNGVPDYIDNLQKSANDFASGKGGTDFEKYSTDALSDIRKDTDRDGIPDYEDISPDYNSEDGDFLSSLDSFNQDIDDLLYGIDRVLAGLNCGFGSESCKSLPLNWAPLATGQDPTFLGMPLGDGLHVREGMPIFSMMNWKKVGKSCVPMPWPPAVNLPGCIGSGAGGRLGVISPTNYLRIFVTPTITGRVGYEVCFGRPPIVAGYTMPPGLSPFVPGGNCIVGVLPSNNCKNDGNDGNVYKKSNGKNIVNLNSDACISKETSTEPYLGDAAGKFINYKKTGNGRDDAINSLVDSLGGVARGGTRYKLPNSPLFVMGDGNSGEEVSLDFDFNSLKNGNFEDVIKIEMPRIEPINDYVMDWVTRQAEEIANKLTDFPTLFIVLPDFNGPYDTKWSSYPDKIRQIYKKVEEKQNKREEKISADISKLQSKINTDNGQSGEIKNIGSQMELLKLEGQKAYSSNKTVAGIKTAYEFLSNIPILNIEPQRINVSLPWVDLPTLTKEKSNFESARKAWEAELKKVEEDISKYGKTEDNEKIRLNANKMISSIDANLAIIEEYKKTPEKIYKMLKVKEVYLEQILCNVETISKYLPGWIGFNGKRFKAWVELYILIKAILKSWQLILDIFYDYDARCHQCKNERHDLMYFIWKLISIILPKIPVIKFPKWPDIYLDLHNIRMLLNITLPEFNFNLRPIVFPSLTLPTGPNLTADLPALPLLPTFKLPILPDLPTLPSVDLPDLPPPPRLPKLLSSISAVLDILKLITKAMCILKTSPFVPEWRAGDQIAYISERQGYLPIDFLSAFASYPQFSLPFVDSIRVMTWVNAEMDIDFISEMARNAVLPINSFTNDAIRVINSKTGNNIDLSNGVPSEINTGIDKNGNLKPVEINYNPVKKSFNIFDFALIIGKSIDDLSNYFEKVGNKEISNDEFKSVLNDEIKSLSRLPEASKIIETLKNASSYTFTKEDKFIQDLIYNSNKKFDELKSILNEEKDKNSELYEDYLKKLSLPHQNNSLISSEIKFSSIDNYNFRLKKFNDKTLLSFEKMITSGEDSEIKEIKETSNKLLKDITTPLNKYKESLLKEENKILSLNNNFNLLAVNSNNTDNSSTNTSNEVYNTSCKGGRNGDGFVYKGIYILEDMFSQISYKLFDYLDEFKGDEITKEVDFDNDNDKEIIYMVGNEIFIKKDLTIKKTKNHYTGDPAIINFKEYFKDYFIPRVNGFEESIKSVDAINIGFEDVKDPKVSNYRIEFFEIVDKFSDVLNNYSSSYIPSGVKRYVIDAFRDIDDITLNLENNNGDYISRKNLAYITSINGQVDIYGYKLKNLKTDFLAGSRVNISPGTKLYAGKNTVKIQYFYSGDDIIETGLKTATILKNTSIEFKEDIVIVSLDGNIYIDTGFKGKIDVNEVFDEPLLPGFIIQPKTDIGTVNIKYYDGNNLSLDFKKDKYYELYDLGFKSDRYDLRTKLDIDYYYANIKAFKKDTYSSYTNQILLSPQKYNDKTNPEISGFNLRIPVYQSKNFDISEYLYDNAGIENIKDVYIDFDLEVDSDEDLDLINDRDFFLGDTSNSKIKIHKEGSKIILKVGKFDDIFTKKALIYVKDHNDNIGIGQITITSYSPTPNIQNYSSGNIIGGLDENLSGEPISIYRFRSGNIKRLKNSSGNFTSPTEENYKYIFGKFDNQKGLSFSSKSGSLNEMSNEITSKEFFKINEETGKIDINPGVGISIRILPSNNKTNDVVFPKLIISKGGVDIYYQYISLSNVGKVNILQDFSEVESDLYKDSVGIYYKHINSSLYSYYSMPLNINHNPGDMFIYSTSDNKKTPVVKIYKDGRVDLVGDLYSLIYSNYKEYVVYKIIGPGGVEIGNILLKPEKNYIIR